MTCLIGNKSLPFLVEVFMNHCSAEPNIWFSNMIFGQGSRNSFVQGN